MNKFKEKRKKSGLFFSDLLQIAISFCHEVVCLWLLYILIVSLLSGHIN